MKKKGIFFENLDSLRFFAFLAVFLKHSFYTKYSYIKDDELFAFVSNFWKYGGFGVNFFFVLSGFLITYLLLNEKQLYGKIDIVAFYIRRTLRIWPLYYATVAFGFVIFPWLKSYFGQLPNETASPLYYIFFMANFDSIWNGLPDSSVLSILWSVAVEEQFYLVWPWFFLLLNKKWYPAIFTLIIGISLIFRYNQMAADPHILKFHTLSLISDMALGGLCAYLSLYSKRFVEFFQTMKKSVIIAIYVLGFFMITYNKSLFQLQELHTVEVVVLGLFFAFIIMEQNYASHSFVKLKNWKRVSYLGRISYGLYCLHFIGILMATTIGDILGTNDTVFGVMVCETLLALTITIIISWISYNYFEKYFLKLKKRFTYISKGEQLI